MGNGEAQTGLLPSQEQILEIITEASKRIPRASRQ